ncbi:hypothetical protein PtA15_6A145 [Puccinia triticina]|uniref:Uncharacterized protein n=1 Tax=Puccinia triticina TaxID=208348 RepID=A0ABY7CNG1_9BASI|nr:uncharacterized protein PtA15_6A145 [Puccinia triticina]WAQ85517.1 hypothetical protein PtA15_6A145 [Puccinia triticina]WAR55398.1 hypothetical protein PtB15_6B139 [Puccinia triticina]
MTRLRPTLLGALLWYWNMVTTATTTDGIFPISHSANHDRDLEIFGNLDDIIPHYDFTENSHSKDPQDENQEIFGNLDDIVTDYNFSRPPKKARSSYPKDYLEDRHPYSPKFFDSHSSDVYNNLKSPVSELTFSASMDSDIGEIGSGFTPSTWESRGKLMNGNQKINQGRLSVNIEKPDVAPEQVTPQKDPTGSRNRKRPVEVKTGVNPSDLEISASTDENLMIPVSVESLATFAQISIHNQKPQDRKAFKYVWDQINKKRFFIESIYMFPVPTEASRVKLGVFLQKADAEISENDIFMDFLGRLPDDENGATRANVCIKLPLQDVNPKTGRYNSESLTSRIQQILKYLNAFHHLFAQDGLNEVISGHHLKILEWFHDFIYNDTKEHPPLLGWACLNWPLEKEKHKRFNPAQMLTYKALSREKLSTSEAAYVALELRAMWYKTETSISQQQLVLEASTVISKLFNKK